MSSNTGRSKTEAQRQEKIKAASKQSSLEKNPCLKEQELSLKCMSDSGYDRDVCSKHFQNYKNCKSFWGHIVKDRRKKNIKPAMPPAPERSAVREQYKNYMPWLP